MKIEVINEENKTIVDELILGVRKHKVENIDKERPALLSVVACDKKAMQNGSQTPVLAEKTNNRLEKR